MLKITSPQNPRFKLAMKLQSARGRKQQARFLIHGHREFGHAVAAGHVEILELFLCPEMLSDGAHQSVAGIARKCGIEVFELGRDLFQRISYGDRVDGVIAVARRFDTRLSALQPADPMLVIVVEGIEKPGNLGAVIRSADGAGVSAVISCGGQTDFFHPNTIRASMGAVLVMPCYEADSRVARDWLFQNSFAIFAAFVGAEEDYRALSFPSRSALVLGNESAGLTELWRGPPARAIALPMRGVVDSLNISVAAAVLMYEAAGKIAELATRGT
jgi:TrmH family RNA methyltransferase